MHARGLFIFVVGTLCAALAGCTLDFDDFPASVHEAGVHDGAVMDSGDVRNDGDASRPRFDAGDDAGRDGATNGKDGQVEPDSTTPFDAGDDDEDSSTAEPFTVSAVIPDDGEALDDETAPIEVTFSRTVDKQSVSDESVLVTREGNAVPGELSWKSGVLSFTPSAPWPLGAHFELELTDEVRAADGTPLTPLVTTFSMAEGRWTTKLIAPAYVESQRLAVSSSGLGALVWTRPGTSGSDIWATRYVNGASDWEDPVQISTTSSAPFHSRVSVAINDAGKIIAGWDHYDYERHIFYDGAWDATDSSINSGYSPDVAMTKTGTWYMAYLTAGTAIEGRTAAPMSPWNLSGDGQGPDFSPRIALLGTTAVAVWTQGTNPSSDVAGNVFDYSSSPETLSTDGALATVPRIASDPGHGSAVAVWQQVDSDWTNIWYSRIVSGGEFGDAEAVSDRESSAANPDVAVDAAGRALVVWQQAVDGVTQIQFSRLTPSKGWSKAEIVSDTKVSSSGATLPVVAVEPGGNAVVAWLQADGSDAALIDVWVARFVSGVGFDDDARRIVSTLHKGESAIRPCAGVDARGRAFVTWMEDGSIWSARFQ